MKLCHLVVVGGLFRCWLILLAMVTLSIGSALSVSAQQTPLPESQVKAAFLASFPKYVDWPARSVGSTNQPIVIGIVGETKTADDLQAMIQTKAINGSPLTFKKLTTEDEAISGCHIIFVADSERKRISTILEKLKGRNVLTVGESEDFLEKGGMINLVRRDRKIRLDVNLNAVRQAQLTISSKLLAAADVVRGK